MEAGGGVLTSCFSAKESIGGKASGGPMGGVGEREGSSSLISVFEMTDSREVSGCSQFGTFRNEIFFEVFDRNLLSGDPLGGGGRP